MEKNNYQLKIKNDFSILIGGGAGQGSRKAGNIIAKLFSELGYRIFIYNDYQSLIKGGHNFSNIRVCSKPVLSHTKKINFLLALNKETIDKHQRDLTQDGIIIYNNEEIKIKNKKALGIAVNSIIKQVDGIPMMNNIALVAGLSKIIGIKWNLLKKVLKLEFKKEQNLNLKVAKLSYKKNKKIFEIKKLNQKKNPLITGNEAVALGAVKAGLKFYFAYPMTPATGILHYLSQNEKKFKIGVVQLENEIAVVNAAIGAAYTGARTMVGTSGGGFALMTEGLSLAAQSENPLVIVESQRMSPATGVPTYNAQGDLSFVSAAGHGDIVRFVIAPGDAEEALFWSGKILNLSWKFQTPSILLIDKEISESVFSVDKNILNKVHYEKPLLWNKKEEYKRYKITKNGISPLAFPGEKGVISKSNSYEHDEFGITVEDEKKVKEMQDKRLRKFKEMEKEVNKLEAIKIYGNKKSKKAIITWGSVKGPAKEAAEKLNIKMIQIIIIQPFPEKKVKKALENVENLIVIEENALGQLGKILNCHSIEFNHKILKYNSRPLLPCEIERKIKKIK